MHEAERAGMKRLARTYLQAVLYKLLVAAAAVSAQYDGASVALVAEERMADMPHMGTYLMGAAGLEDTLNQRDIAEALYHAVMGYGMLAYARVGENTAMRSLSLGSRPMLPSMRPSSSVKLPHTMAL